MHKGRLRTWNEEKGFGFISSENGERDIFIHISALKNMSRRPVAGDLIYYEIHATNDGKQRAVNAKIEGVAAAKPRAKRTQPRNRNNNQWLAWSLPLGVLIIVGLFFYKTVSEEMNHSDNTSHFSAPSVKKAPSIKKATYQESYSCDGKIHCSEMTSCKEATFYLNNCPGTKMDGDGDGVPCERQWCGW